jgi:hypothetical protein
MRVSELLAAQVVDVDGRRLGRVRDVRLVQDGPMLNITQAAMRVDSVVIGDRALPIRLGFGPGGVRGPLALRWIFERLARKAPTISMSKLDWDHEANILRMK